MKNILWSFFIELNGFTEKPKMAFYDFNGLKIWTMLKVHFCANVRGTQNSKVTMNKLELIAELAIIKCCWTRIIRFWLEN